MKNTAAGSFRISIELLEKIEQQALAVGKLPAFVVDFGGQSFYVVRAKDFVGLRESGGTK